MFKNPAELQKFILWAKKQGLKSAKIGDIEFEISDLTQAIDYEAKSKRTTEERDTSKTIVDDPEATKEDEDLLFWSSN